MTTSGSMAVYKQVALGQLTAQEGADILLKPKGTMIRKPTWLPRWAYVLGVAVGAVILAPILSSRDRA